jgi:hypothetical protein
MATTTLPTPETAPNPETTTEADLLVCLPSMDADAQAAAIAHLAAAFSDQPIRIAGIPTTAATPQIQPTDYLQPRSAFGWVLTASDYAAAAALTQQHAVSRVLLLGADASTLPANTLRDLVDAIATGTDLAVPRYPVGPSDALVTTAILYPLSRALFGTDVRFPLPVDAALSPRMLQRLASAATRTIAPTGTEALLWSVAEAATANFRVSQIDTAERTLPPPPDQELNAILASVVGSLFADIETRASFWQRARTLPAATPAPAASDPAGDLTEIQSIIDSFRLASANLGEIWSLVIPPQSLLALKKLAAQPAETFAFDHSLWARTVYDFALAFHGRALNRGHLLGAMTPLYLAWVASHIRSAGNDPERTALLNEATAQAFEREKPYFVSRWRWPDRFNP